jgi:hypothetical protein
MKKAMQLSILCGCEIGTLYYPLPSTILHTITITVTITHNIHPSLIGRWSLSVIGLIVFAGDKIFEYASSDMDTILKRYHAAHEEPLETLSNTDVISPPLIIHLFSTSY